MRNLGKIVAPILFSSIFNLTSGQQDSLPDKFKDYQNKNLKPGYSKALILGKNEYFRVDYFDLNNDSLFDVIELRPMALINGKLEKSRFPYLYYFDFNNDYNLKCFIDFKMDGFNGNEYTIKSPEDYGFDEGQKL